MQIYGIRRVWSARYLYSLHREIIMLNWLRGAELFGRNELIISYEQVRIT